MTIAQEAEGSGKFKANLGYLRPKQEAGHRKREGDWEFQVAQGQKLLRELLNQN